MLPTYTVRALLAGTMPALRSAANGKSRCTIHPAWPLLFSSVRLPPWASAICRLRAKPMPEPVGLMVKKGTKRFGVGQAGHIVWSGAADER